MVCDNVGSPTGGIKVSGPCCRDLCFDDRRQGIETFEVFLVEIGLHQLDPEMPLDLQNELKNIDGIDFQVPTQQRLIVAQILRGQVGDPQALQYNGFELLLNAGHRVRLQHPEHTTKLAAKKRRERFSAVVTRL